MSDSSAVELRFGIQAAKGTPATDGEIVYVTSSGGDLETTESSSEQRRRDGQMSGHSLENLTPSYSFDTHYLLRTFEKHVALNLRSDFGAVVNVVGVAGDIAFVATGNKLTSTTSGKFDTILVGRPIYITGSAIPGNNGWAFVLSRTTGAAPQMVVSWLTITNDTPAGAAVTVSMVSGCVNGTSLRYATIEEWYSDLTENHFDAYYDMVAERMNITIPHPGKIGATFGYRGINDINGGDLSVFTGTLLPVSTNPLLNGARSIYDIREGGIKDAYEYGEVRLDVAFGARTRGALGKGIRNTKVGSNQLAATGNFNVYNDETVAALREKHKNHTPSDFSYLLRDDLGNEELWVMPRVFLTGSPRNPGGNNNFVTRNIPFKAEVHPTFNYTVGVFVRPAA